MNYKDSITSALGAILANKLRSALTMLGVIIGVGSVIAMIAIGEGTKKKSLENIQAMGTDMLTIMPQSMHAGMVGGPYSRGRASGRFRDNQPRRDWRDRTSREDQIESPVEG